MGNIFKEKFKNIWNNEKYISFRKKVKADINRISICVECPKKNNPDFYIKL